MKLKHLIYTAVAALCAFAEDALACWAEHGAQDAITLRAASDLSNYQYRVMRGAGAGLTDLSSVTAVTSLGGQMAIGVLQNDPRSGEAATVAYAGISKAICGAAVTANMLATHNASGQVIDAVSGAVVIGRFLEATNAAGEVASVLLFPATRWGAIL